MVNTSLAKGSSCHQRFRTTSTKNDCNSWPCASNYKKIVNKKYSKCPISRKTTLFHNSLGKNHLESRNFMQNPICKSPMSEENTKLAKIFISGTRRLGNSRERNYLKSSTCTKVFSEQLLISKKSDGKRGPAIN